MDGVALIIPGISQGEADGRYVRRFVGSTLAADTAEINGQPTLYNPNGPVMGGIPADASSVFLSPSGGRFDFRARVTNPSSNQFAGAGFFGIRSRGTYQAPLPVQSNDWLAIFGAAPYDGSTISTSGEIAFIASENIGPANYGTRMVVRLGRVGSNVVETALTARAASAGVSNLEGGQATWRLVPNTRGQLRNPLDNATRLEWDATGLSFHGVTPVARQLLPMGASTNDIINALNTVGLTRLV